MNFKELVVKVTKENSYDEIYKNMVELYPDQDTDNLRAGYAYVLDQLLTLEVVPDPEDLGMRIYIAHVDGTGNPHWEDDDVPYAHVGCITNTGERYAIGFAKWEHMLGYPITSKTFESYVEREMLVHTLWEMTFYGFTQEKIQEVIGEVNDAMQEYYDEKGNDVEKIKDKG